MKKITPLLIFSSLLVLSLASCSNYGKKIKVEGTKGEIYYTGGATESDAKQVGDFLKENSFLTNEKAASVQVVKEGTNYIVRFVYDKKYYDSTEGLENVFKAYAVKMSKKLFDGKKVTIALSDDNFKDFTTIPYDEATAKKLEGGDNETLGKEDFHHLTAGGVTYYWKGISDEESQPITDYITKNGAFEGGTSEIYITKDGDKYLLQFPIKEEFSNDEKFFAEVEKVAGEIKENVFADKPYTFQITDNKLKVIKSFGE